MEADQPVSIESAPAAGAVDAPAAPAAVELRGVTKRYGSIVACDGVDLALRGGEIHGVLGENGAGKSTLMKVMIGLVMPDEGSIHVHGDRCHITDPQAAAALGIGMVHQHFSVVDQLMVWENIALGDSGRLDRGRARAEVVEVGERYGLEVDPDATVGDLSAGLRQRVEIIKCLRRDPRVLVFDEPTSVLTPAESEQLFAVLRRVVREEQRAVALVSHKLEEILHATDLVTIMRRGAVVERMRTAEASAPVLARAMVGREVSLRSESAALGIVGLDGIDAEGEAEASDGEATPAADDATTSTGEATPAADDVSTPTDVAPMLSIRGARAVGADGRVLLDGLDLDVRPGEIFGIAGVEGNGQRPLGDLMSSLLPLDEGTVTVDGRATSTRRAGAMAAAGVGVIPEDRHDSGCVLDMSVADNLFLTRPDLGAERGFLRRNAMRDRAAELIADFDIYCDGPDAPMWSLSGGNQQRVVLARELSGEPKVLVAAQPTHGLDVGAIEYMGARLRAAADSGVAVLLISTEIEEILALSDRVGVIYRGRIAGEMARADVDMERLGILMGGATE
ncbi:MAG: ABC transporter ATP-binding protein [Actinomycetota bacterium]|nr:ABC transporter ATP-binding protein [Actinomycetota bacterium]